MAGQAKRIYYRYTNPSTNPSFEKGKGYLFYSVEDKSITYVAWIKALEKAWTSLNYYLEQNKE